jgi:hypothetical protein
LATPTVAVSGTDDDGEWFFVSPINGTGSTTNGVGTFGEFDFGMSTSSSPNNLLNSGDPNAGISAGNTGMFIFDGFTAGASSPSDFFESDNDDGLSMALRYQSTGPSGKDSAKIGMLVPEPASAVCLWLGIIGLMVLARRKR